MKQIWPNYSYSPATNVLTLTGLNIDRDQLLLVTAADRGRIMYNFADSSVTASAFTSGANTALTLVATTAGLTTTAALVIYYDDQLQSTSVSISNFPATQTIAGTVTANVFGKESFGNTFVPIQIGASGENFTNGNRIGVALINDAGTEFGTTGDGFTIAGTVTIGSALPAGTNRIGVVTIGAGTVTIGAGTAQIGSVTVGNTVTIAGTVTANAGQVVVDQGGDPVDPSNPFPIFGTVDITALPAGTNRIGVVTIGAGTVTLGASTSQIGSVTASISGTVPISISSVTVGNSVTISSLPALVAGTAQIGSVTASISNSVTIASLPAISGTVTANTFALQGTAVTTSNFTSTTASTVLAGFNATREVLTIFNEGAGNLHICVGATCTTIAYQVRLLAGDYYEVPNHQTTITHSAVFATAGTARVTQVS